MLQRGARLLAGRRRPTPLLSHSQGRLFSAVSFREARYNVAERLQAEWGVDATRTLPRQEDSSFAMSADRALSVCDTLRTVLKPKEIKTILELTERRTWLLQDTHQIEEVLDIFRAFGLEKAKIASLIMKHRALHHGFFAWVLNPERLRMNIDRLQQAYNLTDKKIAASLASKPYIFSMDTDTLDRRVEQLSESLAYAQLSSEEVSVMVGRHWPLSCDVLNVPDDRLAIRVRRLLHVFHDKLGMETDSTQPLSKNLERLIFRTPCLSLQSLGKDGLELLVEWFTASGTLALVLQNPMILSRDADRHYDARKTVKRLFKCSVEEAVKMLGKERFLITCSANKLQRNYDSLSQVIDITQAAPSLLVKSLVSSPMRLDEKIEFLQQRVDLTQLPVWVVLEVLRRSFEGNMQPRWRMLQEAGVEWGSYDEPSRFRNIFCLPEAEFREFFGLQS